MGRNAATILQASLFADATIAMVPLVILYPTLPAADISAPAQLPVQQRVNLIEAASESG